MSESLGPGSNFAGCRLEAVGGRGGMGVVYRGTQLALGRPVAVKAIAPELAEDAEYRERFKRESRLAASIDHPNVIPVYEAGESDGVLYLIMRWVDGTDLRATLTSSGRLAPARAVRLLRPVALALAAAHKQGLVHRDVKPANVLIARGTDEDDEHVYLTDFGIARRLGSNSVLTSTGMFVGTVDYMAPERVIGGKGDSRSDIYSFGCMLYEALSGKVPFERPSNVAAVFAHVNDPVPSVRAVAPAVPERLDTLVATAMAKRPEDRFASAGALAHSLGEALAEMNAEERALGARTELADIPPEPETESETVRDAAPETARDVAPETVRDAAPETVREVAPPTEFSTAPETRLSAAPAHEPPAPAGRRRPGLRAAGIAAVAAVGVVVAIIALSGSSPKPASLQLPGTTPGDEVTAISPGLTKLQTIRLGSAPGGVAIGQGGDVWASLPDAGAIVRIAPDRSVARFPVAGHPELIAVGSAGIWVTNSSSSPLTLLDGRTGRQIATAHLSSAPIALTVDQSDGSAWTADSSGMVVHVDPSGSPIGQAARVPPPVTGLGWGEGWVWAVNGAANGLIRVSLDGSGSTTSFDTHPGPISVTFDQGVWTAHAAGNVTRFDPRPGFLRVNTDTTVASSLDAIDALENQPSVWAISKQAQKLFRLSTQPGAPVTGTVQFAGVPVALGVTASSVWVGTANGNLTQIGL